MKKKIMLLMLGFIFAIACLSACSSTDQPPNVEKEVSTSSDVVKVPETITVEESSEIVIVPDDTVITFADEKFEAAVRNQIGKSEGDILYKDVARVESLEVSRCDITDLSGIEYFTALVLVYNYGHGKLNIL